MAEETETEKQEGEEETAEDSAKAGRMKLILMVGAAVLLGAGAGAGFMLLRTPHAPEGGAEAAAHGEEHPFEEVEPAHPEEEEVEEAHASDGASKEKLGTMFPLDTFIVNVGDNTRDRYLKLKAELELSNTETGEEIEGRLPQIRDLLISLLASKGFDDIRSIEGKAQLRQEILQRVNAVLSSGKARNVFFTEFVIQ